MRYFIAIAGLIFVSLAIIAIFLAKVGKNDSDVATPSQVSNISKFINGSSEFSLGEVGRIVAPENHREIRIVVTSAERRFEIIRGYDGKVVKSKVYANTLSSYDEFARAVAVAGFMSKQKSDNADEKGICPEGTRYNFSLRNLDKEVVDTWATSCRTSDGTFAGDNGLVRRLFQAQIPDYNQLISEPIL